MIAPSYVYKALVTRVIDGDTFIVTADLGVDTSHQMSIRVRNLSEPELSAPGGLEARARAAAILLAQPNVLIQTYRMSFARYVADVYLLPSGQLFADAMIASRPAPLP